MGEEQEQETLENVDAPVSDKQTGELSQTAAAAPVSSAPAPNTSAPSAPAPSAPAPKALANDDEQPTTLEDAPVSPEPLGGPSTGDFPPASPTRAHHKGPTGGRQRTTR